MQPMMFFHRNYLKQKEAVTEAGEATKNGACCGGFPWMRCSGSSGGGGSGGVADDTEQDLEPERKPKPEQRKEKSSKKPRRDGSSRRRDGSGGREYGEVPRNP